MRIPAKLSEGAQREMVYETLDVNGRQASNTDQVTYIGKAWRTAEGWRTLANVQGALCIVEVTVHAPPPEPRPEAEGPQKKHLSDCRPHDADDEDWWECAPGCLKPARPNSRDRKTS